MGFWACKKGPVEPLLRTEITVISKDRISGYLSVEKFIDHEMDGVVDIYVVGPLFGMVSQTESNLNYNLPDPNSEYKGFCSTE